MGLFYIQRWYHKRDSHAVSTHGFLSFIKCYLTEYTREREVVMEELRYSIIVDGNDRIGCASIKDARFYAQTETLNSKEQVEIYDNEDDKVIETYYPEDL